MTIINSTLSTRATGALDESVKQDLKKLDPSIEKAKAILQQEDEEKEKEKEEDGKTED